MLVALANAVEAKDPGTEQHSSRLLGGSEQPRERSVTVRFVVRAIAFGGQVVEQPLGNVLLVLDEQDEGLVV